VGIQLEKESAEVYRMAMSADLLALFQYPSTEVKKEAYAWLSLYVALMGDSQPNRNEEIHLEHRTKTDIHAEYVGQMKGRGDDYISYNDFTIMWKQCFSHVKIRVYKAVPGTSIPLCCYARTSMHPHHAHASSISSYIMIYDDISSYIIIYHHISSYTIIYHHISSYTTIYHHISSYIIIYHHIPSYTIIYHHIPSYTIIYHHIPSYTIIYHHTPSYITIYHHISSYIIIYHHIPSFTIIHHHIRPPSSKPLFYLSFLIR
jgi:hypothetical protein